MDIRKALEKLVNAVDGMLYLNDGDEKVKEALFSGRAALEAKPLAGEPVAWHNTEPRVRPEGCQHTLKRMREWIDEGACPICAVAASGTYKSMVDACAKYLKEGERPAERMERDHREILALISMLAKERAKTAPHPGTHVMVPDKLVSVVLQAFRREIDVHMDTKHPSASPGHDAMRIALREGFAALAASGAPGQS